LAEYVESRKQPYAFEFLNLGKEFGTFPLYQKWGGQIDEFVKSEMDSMQLNDTIESYESILRNVLDSIGVHPETNSRVVLEKLYKWITKIVAPQRKLERRREEIRNG